MGQVEGWWGVLMDGKGYTGWAGGEADFCVAGSQNGTPGALRGPPGPGVLAALRRTGQRSFLAQHHLAHEVPATQCWISSGLPSEAPITVRRGLRYSTLARRQLQRLRCQGILAPAICSWSGLLLRVVRHGAPTMRDDDLSRRRHSRGKTGGTFGPPCVDCRGLQTR